jgi:hypothetical protein
MALRLPPNTFPGGPFVGWGLLLAMTSFIAWIAVRSLLLMRDKRYFPAAPPVAQRA